MRQGEPWLKRNTEKNSDIVSFLAIHLSVFGVMGDKVYFGKTSNMQTQFCVAPIAIIRERDEMRSTINDVSMTTMMITVMFVGFFFYRVGPHYV